jgi:Holliday junction resolvase-like predicted endonuclease
MTTALQVGLAGERIVVDWLTAKGYKIDRWDTQSPGSTDIEASGTTKRLLIQVKSATAPGEPSALSTDEIANIKSRAAKVPAEAWQAQVHLDSQLAQVGEIKWTKVN